MSRKFWLEDLKGRDRSEDRRKCDDNIKTDLREIVLEGVDWIHVAEDRGRWRDLVKTVMNL